MDFGLFYPGSNPFRSHCVVYLDKTYIITIVPANEWNSAMDYLPIQGEVKYS